jgi:hypothetical protein
MGSTETPHTNIHNFLVAQPGSWMPVTKRSPLPEPTTWDEYIALTKEVADDLEVPIQYVKYMCTIELINEPWVEPELVAEDGKKVRNLITPDRKIVVPPGVRL